MRKIITLGELLIDFIPSQKGVALSEVTHFEKIAGGAPANVAVAAVKVGSEAYFLGQVGSDGFGDYLAKSLQLENVNTTYLTQTDKANTALAFVSLTKEGERDFIFYRNPSADQLYEGAHIPASFFKDSILHFCSVSLIEDLPIKHTHDRLIPLAKSQGAWISYDPNVRLALAKDQKHYQQTIRSYLNVADIVKVAKDELEFITGLSTYDAQIAYFDTFSIKLLIITLGSQGALLYVNKMCIQSPTYPVQVNDTTGAGDAFIGAFLSQIGQCDTLDSNPQDVYDRMLSFSNAYAALTTTKPGAIAALPTKEEALALMKKL